MKDIYSPLEIDEEWDQRAPVMEGSVAAPATSVDVAPGTSDAQPMAEMPAVEGHTDTPAAVEGTLPEVGQTIPVAGGTEATPDPTTDTAQIHAETPIDATPAPTISMHNEDLVAGDTPPTDTETDNSADAAANEPAPAMGELIHPQAQPEGQADEVAPDASDEHEEAETPAVEDAEDDADTDEADTTGDLPLSPMAEHEDEVAGDDHETDSATKVSTTETEPSTGSSVIEDLERLRKEAKEKAEAEIARLEKENEVDNGTITELQSKMKERTEQVAALHDELEKSLAA